MKRINELILRTRSIPREFYDSVSYDEYVHTKNSEEAPTQKRSKESQKNKKCCKQYVNKKEILNEQEDISLFDGLNNDESSKSRLRDVRKRNKLNEERRKDIEKITQNNYIIQNFEDQIEKKENDNNSNNNENDSSTELEYFNCIDSSKEKKPRKKTPKKKNVREFIKSLQNKKTKRSYKEQIKYFEEIEKRVNQQSLTKVYPHFQKKETSFIQIASEQNDNNNVNDTHEIIDLNVDDGIDLENNEIVINRVIPEMSLIGVNEMKENQKNYRDNSNERQYINIDYISHVPVCKHARSRSNSRERTKRSYSKEEYENYERKNDKECSKILLADKEMWEEFKEFVKFKQMLQQEENNKQEIFEKVLTESYRNRNNYNDDKCQAKDGSLYDPSFCKKYSLSEQSRKSIITNEDINSTRLIERRKRRRMKYYW
ncbi:hypothetical protein ENU1_057760 [Entamoeba nuttalli P19]|uniref:Uncharacterized protein n=1 Tax=Entamoeba nuttalli (strain P19) TaxID=1076696 RepID=K2HEZ5_ENTNP|nr:hypothetical protein ENU1_057760 [Entamoeba nuttalli P19]EKE41384.1 hypothetical protein ENU1_057760 [Entamoeba nuttalli P19]|eukprot:XP_008856282.1 hypothetical protein ENU1_057760 [Entamoeba nuttalli P19]